MKNKKLFRISFSILSSTLLTSSVGFTIVSCAKETIEYSWTQFLVDAEKTEPFTIVQNTKPSGWENTNPDQLTFQNVEPDLMTKTLNVIIARSVDGKILSDATFSVKYNKNKKYNIIDWKCTRSPEASKGTWANFKLNALKETATNLLEQAKKNKYWNTFNWKYGNEDQVRWVGTDIAEFDVYGTLHNIDASGYKGMQGLPKANDDTHTVTAIISKKGKNGAFDSDPIEATIEFDQFGDVYQLSKWTFKQKTQLQSFEKFSNLVDIEIQKTDLDSGGSLAEFQPTNWVTFAGGDSTANEGAEQHDTDFDIDYALDKNQIFNHDSADRIKFEPGSTLRPEKKQYINDQNKGYETHVVTADFKYDSNEWRTKLAELTLKYNYIFANGKDISGGGTAFNYIWVGSLKTWY